MQGSLEHFGTLLHEWWVEAYGEESFYEPVTLALPTRSRECLGRSRYLISTTVDPPRRAGREDITAESTPTPYWLDPQLGFDAEQGAFWMFQLTDAVGWPFRAARSSLMLAPISTAPPHHAAEVRGGIALFPMEDVWSLRNPSPTEWAWSQWRAIPLDPIWPGLLLDVVFWAATLGVLFHGSGAVRRWWRAANGRCRGCGHIMYGVAVCPECGGAAAQRPADPHVVRAQD